MPFPECLLKHLHTQVIRIPGYIADEKVHIARQYLEPQTRDDAGVPPDTASITDEAMAHLINEYARYAALTYAARCPVESTGVPEMTLSALHTCKLSTELAGAATVEADVSSLAHPLLELRVLVPACSDRTCVG